jgi:hypothetical protein
MSANVNHGHMVAVSVSVTAAANQAVEFKATRHWPFSSHNHRTRGRRQLVLAARVALPVAAHWGGCAEEGDDPSGKATHALPSTNIRWAPSLCFVTHTSKSVETTQS